VLHALSRAARKLASPASILLSGFCPNQCARVSPTIPPGVEQLTVRWIFVPPPCLRRNLQGAKSALPIWTEFMKRAVSIPQYGQAKPFPAPHRHGLTNLVSARYDLLCAIHRLQTSLKGKSILS
jgi:hypothetical protein